MIVVLSIIIVALSILCVWLYRTKHANVVLDRATAATNQRLQGVLADLREENKALTNQKKALEQQQDKIRDNIQIQNNIYTSLLKSNEEFKKTAEAQVHEYYEAKLKEANTQLEQNYKAAAADLQEQIDAIVQKKEQKQQELQDIEAKQLAYIEAQNRQKQIEANQDFYRLVIDKQDQQDVKALRELQYHFFRKESIDKLIWEVYYKPAYDALVARLFGNKTKVCGIYKITDLTSGQSYIGQSVDVKERFRQHIKASLAFSGATNKLYQTLQKVGQYNFTFEVLEEVERPKLNEREAYWIDFYKTRDYGLNSMRGNVILEGN